MRNAEELRLAGQAGVAISLPPNYEPVRPAYFDVGRIYLAKGSLATPERRRFVERICDLYPEVPVEERLPELLALPPYGFCPYGCRYCYLAGTPGVRFSPSVKIYVNLPEMLAEIDHIASRLATPTAFYLGELQGSLALDPLTAYSTVLAPFFAEHPWARLTLLTKSAHVGHLLDLEHRGIPFCRGA